jgi:hypothetical protein
MGAVGGRVGGLAAAGGGWAVGPTRTRLRAQAGAQRGRLLDREGLPVAP